MQADHSSFYKSLLYEGENADFYQLFISNICNQLVDESTSIGTSLVVTESFEFREDFKVFTDHFNIILVPL